MFAFGVHATRQMVQSEGRARERERERCKREGDRVTGEEHGTRGAERQRAAADNDANALTTREMPLVSTAAAVRAQLKGGTST